MITQICILFLSFIIHALGVPTCLNPTLGSSIVPSSFSVQYWNGVFTPNVVPWPVTTGVNPNAMLMADGNTYTNFLVIHAPSYIQYALNGAYTAFTAIVGLALSSNGCAPNYTGYFGNSEVKIFADGVEVWSGMYDAGTDWDAVNLDVTGVNTLRIQSFQGSSTTCDHNTIANPLFCTACDTEGASLSKPHECSCETSCVNPKYCNSFSFVESKLRQYVASGQQCPAGSTCCCSCPNCAAY